MIGKDLLVLQDCMKLMELGPKSCAKREIMDIKFEVFMDRKEEGDSIRMTILQIKTEHEVSCKSVCPQ
jgi:hypothetical protein